MRIFILATIATILVAVGGSIYFRDSGLITSREEASESVNLLSKLPPLPVESKAPALDGIVGWINSEELSEQDLRGKVVLIDFWTYSCINCIRTFPHLSALWEKYKDNGFILLGVHSPEFEFEKDRNNILNAVKKHNLKYPIALDSNHATWNAFANQYWPAHYLVDVDGNIRYHHFGEGAYSETEGAVQQLLLEAGLLSVNKLIEETSPSETGFKEIATPEIYLGYKRINNLGNQEESIPIDQAYEFSEPENIAPNRFYFVGSWKIGAEMAVFVGEDGKIIIHYKASKVNMVLVSENNISTIELKLDGQYLNQENKGRDVFFKSGKSLADIQLPQLYNLVDTGNNYDWHILEIILDSPGLSAFTFTFG